MPIRLGRPWPSGRNEAVSLNISLGFLKGTLSVPMSMMLRLCLGLSTASLQIFRSGYVPRDLLTCSQPCKWLNKLVRRLPLHTRVTNALVNVLCLSLCLLHSIIGITRQWSLAPQRRSAGAATYVASMGIRLRSAPRVNRQLPTLLPTNIPMEKASSNLNLIICS